MEEAAQPRHAQAFLTQEQLLLPVPVVCSVPAPMHTPFQEWLSSMLANKMMGKKIRNYSWACKWKDEHGAKREGSKCEIPHCCMSLGRGTHHRESGKQLCPQRAAKGGICAGKCFNQHCPKCTEPLTAATRSASTPSGSWPAKPLLMQGDEKEAGKWLPTPEGQQVMQANWLFSSNEGIQ